MVRKLALLFGFLLAFALTSQAQTTTVSGTISDTTGQIFANGTWSANLQLPGYFGPFYVNGVPLTPAQMQLAGVLDGTGSFTTVLFSNTNPVGASILPAGSQWRFQVCPLADSPCTTQVLTVSGTTQSVSASIKPPPIVVNGSANNQPKAYKDAEVQGATVGFTYFNLTDNTLHLCELPVCTWVSLTSGAAGNPAAPTGSTQFNNGGVFGGGPQVTTLAIKPFIADAVQFVSTSGNDANDGLSFGTAKLTAAAAETALPVGGGVIQVQAGTFSGAITLSKPTILLCQSPLTTILTIPNAANVPVITETANGDQVSGCTIDGNISNQSSTNATGITITSGLSSPIVTGNTIQNTYGPGVLAQGNGFYPFITRNTFTNNNQASATTFAVDYQEPSNGTTVFLNVSYNLFDENNSGCVRVEETDTGGSPATLVENTTISENQCISGASVSFQTIGVFLQTNDSGGSGLNGAISNSTIANNLINAQTTTAGSQTQGINVNGAVLDTTIENNNITSMLSACVVIGFPSPTAGISYTIDGNTCTDSGNMLVDGTGQSNVTISGNTFRDSNDTAAALSIGATSATLAGVNVNGNSFLQSGAPNKPAQSAILFNGGVVDSSIVGNNITNQLGVTQIGAAIGLATSSHNLITSNQIQGYIGSGGNGGVGILIGSGSTSNVIGVNNFDSVTTNYSDSGTTTIFSDIKPTNRPSGAGQVCISINGFQCTWGAPGSGPGSGTQFNIAYWATTSSLGSVPCALTGQVLTGNNGAAPTCNSVGVSGRTVAGTSDTILCDSGTATLDRANTIKYTSTSAVTITVPDAGSSGCSSNFAFKVLIAAASGTVSYTFNRTTTSTFTVVDGGTATIGATSVVMKNGMYATFWSPDNTNYLVTLMDTNGTGAAGGDLCGSYPNPTVCQVEGATIPTSAPVVGTNGSKQVVASTGDNIAAPRMCSDTSGSGTAQSCTTTPTFVPVAKNEIIYITTTDNSGTSLTLNVNSQGNKTVAKWQGSATTLQAHDVRAGEPVLATYDGTAWILQSIGNAPAGTVASVAATSPLASSGGANPNISINTNGIGAGQLGTQYSKLPCEPGLGDGQNAIPAATYIQFNCVNKSGVTWTITGISCWTDNAGTSSLTATNNAGTALLTGAVTCNNTKSGGGNAGTQSGTTTLANNDAITFSFISDGTSKTTTWTVGLTQ